MKKMIILLFSIFIVWFIMISLIVYNNNINKLVTDILDNTNISIVEYVNYYDDYYIVRDSKNLYLFDKEYKEILSINLNLLFDKYDKYDIVYRNKTLMYMEDYKNKDVLIFKYYDIYTGECIDEVLIGGFYE